MPATTVDPILASILGKKIEAIAKEMALVLERTARSPLFQVRDFCTVILDDRRRILSQEEGLPQMAYAVIHALRYLEEFFGADISDGDVYILNDPYYGGNQAQDTAIFRPIFIDGQLRLWAAAKGHLADLGGAVLGGYHPGASDIWAENFRIPPLRIVRKHDPQRDVWNLLMENTRLPHYVGGDLQAQIGATGVAETRLRSLWETYGEDQLTSHMDFLLDATETRMRAELEAFPNGDYYAESTYEHDLGGVMERHTARLKATIDDGHVTLDYTGTDPQCAYYYNGVYGTTFSAAVAVFLMLVDPDIPHNDGVLRCIDVRVPRGSFLNASFPAPCVQGNFTCQDIAMETIFRALADAVPDRVTAGWNRGESHNVRGVDPRTGRLFFDPPLIANKGGAGGTLDNDGWSNIGAIACGGGYAAQDYEVWEAQIPALVLEHDYRTDSGGEGEFRGGLGIRFRYRLLADEATVCVYGEDTDEPFGLFGGRTGAANLFQARRSPDAPWDRLIPNRTYLFPKGCEIEALNAGGGGYGAPHVRPVGKVVDDVRKGFVSVSRAQEYYGVVFASPNLELNEDATRERRVELRQQTEAS
jgi:N-methylhydantoinase B